MLLEETPTKKRRTPTTCEDRNISINELIAITGRSRSSVLRDVQAGRLPQPYKFGSSMSSKLYWRLSEVRACLDSVERKAA